MKDIKIVCVDLDGTIAHYDTWKGEAHFGHVIKDSADALLRLRNNGWLIIIYTTRTNKKLISHFLNSNNLVYDYINENPDQPKNAIGGKPYADVYIDDRAIQFNGNWNKVVLDIEEFQPWEKKVVNYMKENNHGEEFLKHDFDQSYQQLRHYDSLNWDITKFSFIELMLGVTAIWAIYGYANNSDNQQTLISLNYKWLIPTIFGICYLFSLLATFLISRNRVYFAKVARYLNEHRKFSLDMKPYGFQNKTRFYTKIEFPPAFDKWSTQLVCLYVIALTSSFMFGAMIYCITSIFISSSILYYFLSILGGVISLIINLYVNISYMMKQDENLGK